jgi:hypothetical protein
MWHVLRQIAYGVLVERPEGKRQLGRSSIDGSIILKWILKKSVGSAWTGLIWLMIGAIGTLL